MTKNLLTYIYLITLLVSGCAFTSCAGPQGVRGQAASSLPRNPENVRPSSERYYDLQAQDWKFKQD